MMRFHVRHTPPSGGGKRLVLIVAILAVYLMHQDFWNWTNVEPLLFGFLPIGLWYHAVYSLLASALMWLLVKLAWPRSLEDIEKKRPAADPR